MSRRRKLAETLLADTFTAVVAVEVVIGVGVGQFYSTNVAEKVLGRAQHG